MTKTIAAIDGNSLMHRAYHAIQTPMISPDGTPTNAVFGFMQMFVKFIEIAHPDAVVCAFDAGKPVERIAKMQRYKAQRPHMDEELRVQFPVIEELMDAMKVPVVKVPGWEGDDILGTIAARDEALGFKTLLVTGDKDACQLASDLTRIVTTKRGITDVAIMDPDAVVEKYGIGAGQFIDYLGLMGDASDNIPGVPGIGAKTAAKLLQTYGSIDGIYEHIDELKGKQRANLEQFKDDAYLSREIATIKCDLDFECDLEGVAFPSYSAADVTDVFKKYALNAPLARVLSLVGESVGAASQTSVLEVANMPALDLAVPAGAFTDEVDVAFAKIERAVASGEMLGLCVLTSQENTLFGPELRLGVAMSDSATYLVGEPALKALSLIVTKGNFASLDVKETLRNLYPADTAVQASINAGDVQSVAAFDISLAAYILDSAENTYTYEGLAEKYLGATVTFDENDEDSCVQKAMLCQKLVEPLKNHLETEDADRVFYEIDMPLIGVLLDIERTGMAVDCERLHDLGCTSGKEIDALKQTIYNLAGETFNIDSPKQLSHILFEVMGLPHAKKTTRGFSTNAKVLGELAATEPIAAEVLRYRELAKIKSTYIDTLPKLRGVDGRIHTRLHQTVTTTGRLSSSDPNLQNIPVRSQFGKQIRESFIPIESGDVFVSADYSQIELRLLAHLSQDEHLIGAFLSGEDFHASTASRVFGVPQADVTPQMRSRSKAVNFGIVYGQQAFGLSQSLGISMAEAREMIERYFEAYPGVRAFLDRTIESAKEKGYAETMFGRRRYIPEFKSSNRMMRAAGERNAMNHPMQGSAADIIKIAMNRVARRLDAEGFKAKLIMQVHDELDFSVPQDEVEALSKMVKEVMEGAADLSVPLIAEIGVGSNWGEAH